MPAAFPIEAVEKLLQAAEERGVSKASLLSSAGIEKPGKEIGLAPLCALYERAARLTGDDALGLHVGEASSPRMYGPLGYIVANSANLGEALASLADYQPLWTRAAGITLRRRNKAIALRYWLQDDIPAEERRQESEQMLATLITFLREATGVPLSPTEVRFEHSAPADLTEHRRLFASRIVFGAPATEVVLAEPMLALPIPRADSTLAELMRSQARSALAERKRREPFLERLRDTLEEAILEGRSVALPDAAGAMGMGPRTLQRRLRQDGLTFRTVVEQARTARARDMLAEPGMVLAQIAFRLGFSQTSAFHRAFRRHTGTTPGAFRRALEANEEPARNV